MRLEEFTEVNPHRDLEFLQKLLSSSVSLGPTAGRLSTFALESAPLQGQVMSEVGCGSGSGPGASDASSKVLHCTTIPTCGPPDVAPSRVRWKSPSKMVPVCCPASLPLPREGKIVSETAGESEVFSESLVRRT